MCIAILTLAGRKLDRETFDRCWKKNNQGAGLAYSNGSEMVIVKELKSVDRFWRLYCKHRDANMDIPMLVHFRIRTHGKVDYVSTQPIQINKDLAYIHNGMIYKVPNSPDYSDTVMFKKEMLSTLPNGFHLNKTILRFIEEFIGSSKLVFLDVKNRWSVCNPKAGTWDNGIWYSNDGYKEWTSHYQGGRHRGCPPFHTPTAQHQNSSTCSTGRDGTNHPGPLESAVPLPRSQPIQPDFEWTKITVGKEVKWVKRENGREHTRFVEPQELIDKRIAASKLRQENPVDRLLDAACKNTLGLASTAPDKIFLPAPKQTATHCALCDEGFKIDQTVYLLTQGSWVCDHCKWKCLKCGETVARVGKVEEKKK